LAIARGEVQTFVGLLDYPKVVLDITSHRTET
jgi:hypothetical protein